MPYYPSKCEPPALADQTYAPTHHVAMPMKPTTMYSVAHRTAGSSGRDAQSLVNVMGWRIGSASVVLLTQEGYQRTGSQRAIGTLSSSGLKTLDFGGLSRR